LFDLTLEDAGAGVEIMRFERIRIETNGLLEFGLCFCVTLHRRQGRASRSVRFRQAIVERQRLFAQGENSVERNWFGRSQIKEGIAVCYSGVSARIRWIELRRFNEHLARCLIT